MPSVPADETAGTGLPTSSSLVEIVTTAFAENASVNVTSVPTRTCGPFPSQPDNCILLSHLRRSASCLSLAGCVIVIFLIWVIGKYRTSPAQRMIFFLMLSSLFQSLGGILSDPNTHSDSSLCQAQAFLQQTGNWLVMTWVMCIGVSVAYNVLGSRKSARTVTFERVCHIIVCTLSLTMGLIPLISGAFGHTGGWCWITSKYTTMRFATLYIPLYMVLAIILIVYFLIFLKLRRKARQIGQNACDETEASRPQFKQQKKKGMKEARTLLAYPLIYLLLALFPLVNRLYQALKGEGETILTLVALHAISIPFLGLANSLVYGLNKRTIRELRRQPFLELLRTRAEATGLIKRRSAALTKRTNSQRVTSVQAPEKSEGAELQSPKLSSEC